LDLGEVARFGAVKLHVLPARIAKQLCRARGFRDAPRLRHDGVFGAGWVLYVFEQGPQASGEHLFEADDHDTVGGAVGNGLPRHVQAYAASGAVVVDVVDGDACHAKLVEDALAAGGVAIAAVGDALVDGVVVSDGGTGKVLGRGKRRRKGRRISKPGSVYSTLPRGFMSLVRPMPRT